MPSFAVILPAAGRSTRFGGPQSKIFTTLGEMPILFWTVRCFSQRHDVAQIVIATNDATAVIECLGNLTAAEKKKIVVCPGGDSRAHSVLRGVEHSSPDIEWIAIHDAARPLASQTLINRVFAAAEQHGCAVPALPVHLTIKQAVGPLPAPVQETIPRHHLWAMQTPQAMRRQDLLNAYADCPMPLSEVTDDAQLIELAGKAVWLVTGEEHNLKITTPMDLKVAEMLIEGK
jgi:2-C-methyl-D-erythritol 4-phosphate cytidylyltransferase